MKKGLLLLLATLLCVLCVWTLTSCDDEPETQGGEMLGDEELHTHAWSEWKVTMPAFCQAEGEETRTCACGASEKARILEKTSVAGGKKKTADRW